MKSRFPLFTLTMLVATCVLAACASSAAPAVVAPSAAPDAVANVSTAVSTAAAPAAPPATVAATSTIAPTAVPASTAATDAALLPVFSNPTEITNPYYPVSPISQTISLGREDGKPARAEVTLLPDIKTISWAGGDTQVRVSQFVAYSDDQLVEVAYDYFAQADNGDVYYFGEDVANYEDGQISDHEGSWLAGKDCAPPALIMPAKPEVGMVFNPENLPGVVFETDEVLSLSEQATIPAGAITDGLLIKETLMDGSIEHKIYAAGFGVVEAETDGEKVVLVLLDRADAAPGAVPASLQNIEAQAEAIIDDVPGGDWAKVSGDVTTLADAWTAYQAQATADGAPQVLQDAFAAALTSLQQASADQNATETMQAANDVSAAVMDLFSVYHPAVPPDLGRLDVLERAVVIDVADQDFAAAADSIAKIEAIWARLKPSVLAHNGTDVAQQFDASLAAQHAALQAKDGATLTTDATDALEFVDALEQVY